MRFVSVAEDHADHRLARKIVNAALIHAHDWLDADLIEKVVTWSGLDNDAELHWKDRKHLTLHTGKRPRARSRFSKLPGASYAQAAVGMLMLIEDRHRRGREVNAVVLLVDQDDQPERRAGLDQARRNPKRAWPFAIAYGVPVTKRESWVLLGFEPRSEPERRTLDELRRELRHHPTRAPQELKAKHDSDRGSAKRVLARLTGEDPEREEACEDTLCEKLGDRPIPDETGLRAFIDEIEAQLRPLF